MEYDYDSYENELQTEYLYPDEDEEDEVYFNNITLEHILVTCIRPTLEQTFHSLKFVFVWIFIFRISTQIGNIPFPLRHILSLVCGLFALNSIFPSSFFLLILLPIFSYLPLRLPAYRGGSVLLLSVVFLVFCELFWLKPQVWHQIRGAQMILIMKTVSLGFDVDIGTIRVVPNFIEYSGYLFCPGNCVFGPWSSYLAYVKIYERTTWQPFWYRPYWIGSMIGSLSLALLFLVLSTCGTHYLLPNTSWLWLAAYRDALSFRCSHYFVSFFSEATLLLAGYTKTCFDDRVHVVKPWHIEVPRSLIQVVVSWNLPMHTWLKIYVFNTTRQFGNFMAVLSTYAVSAILHGLNFQLAAVLLSLGLYSYVEFMLRRKLAQIFSACIQARPCKEQCNHQYRWNHIGVIAVNLLFSAVTLLHLAYLGVMFDTSEASDSGYNYQHTLAKWSDLSFISHYVAFFSYLVYFFI